MSYHPTLGRWLETDPVPYVDGLNLYEMEQSNPVKYTDPLGTYVNASFRNNAVYIEAGIILWSPWDKKTPPTGGGATTQPTTRPAKAPMQLYLNNVKANIERGLTKLELENSYEICLRPSGRTYPIHWSATVQVSPNHYFLGLTPNNKWHYVEVQDGFPVSNNSFSPSMTLRNNVGGKGRWSFLMGDIVDDDNAWWAAHEVLHFAGLGDLYNYVTQEPFGPYVNVVNGVKHSTNIMAGNKYYPPSWKLNHDQMEEILRRRLEDSNQWRLGTDYVVQP